MQAQAALGEIYELGQGVKADYQEAAAWYRQAVDQGDTNCATRLGAMFVRGEGVGRDLQEAVKLWSWAAEQGNAYAQFNLAGLYMTGTGVQRDLVKANSLYTLAGKTLDVSKQLSELSSKMGPDELATVQ
jgi:TPR repeat protein